MPLMPGNSPQTLSQNIGELMDTFKSKGRIGNTFPKTGRQAQKIAAAIAYKKAGE